MSADNLNKFLNAMDTAVKELGPNLPPRQLMTLLIIAREEKAARTIGVRDIDQALGNLPNGSASKILKTMMHVEGERKTGVANIVKAERDPEDLRKWNLSLTPKSSEIVEKVISCL